jgi:integrase
MSSHAGRKTFINLALERGLNPVLIAKIVGHEDTDLIMNTYGSARAGLEQFVNLW